MPELARNQFQSSEYAEEYQPSLESQASLDGLTAYINAGGRGTRLNPIFAPDPKIGVTKALLEIGNPPLRLVDHHVNKLDSAGVPRIIVGAGDHVSVKQHVDEAYENNPRVFAVSTVDQLGNGGDLVRAVRDYPRLFEGQVLITNVDTLLDLDEAAMFEQHRITDADLTIALTRNRGVPNEGAYVVGPDSNVVYCGEAADRNGLTEEDAIKRSAYRGSSTGALVIKSELLKNVNWSPEDGPLSLYKDIVGVALGKGAVYAYDNGRRLFTDVGTVQTWTDANEQIEVLQRHLYYPSN
ncbi:nucleotidyltransferase family protein [Streptomyces sp. NPDC001273]|uniref:nucleotidyltransferase family protein n=1 Tax=unclassified Streptomyces TaxID=2593676 RepID=UPI0033FB409F